MNVDDFSDAEVADLSTLGAEAILLFSVSASAVTFAIGLWFSIDSAFGPDKKSPVGSLLFYGGLPFLCLFALIAAVLGSIALQDHRRQMSVIQSRTETAGREFAVKKDGMDVDLPVPKE